MEKKLLETGKIVTTHGIKGEVRIDVWSDSPESLLDFEHFYLKDDRRLDVEAARIHKSCLNVKFLGIDSIDDALPLMNQVVYIDTAETVLPAGVYFVKDLIGMTVSDADTKECYGKITQVQPTGSNDVYYVDNESGRQYLIPAIKDVIVSVDVEKKEMAIRPLPGLMEI